MKNFFTFKIFLNEVKSEEIENSFDMPFVMSHHFIGPGVALYMNVEDMTMAAEMTISIFMTCKDFNGPIFVKVAFFHNNCFINK